MFFKLKFNSSSSRVGRFQKNLMILKLTILLIFSVSLQVNATVIPLGITISQNNVSLEKVFKEIENQSDCGFLFKSNEAILAVKTSKHFTDALVEVALDNCLKVHPLPYTISHKLIKVETKPRALVAIIDFTGSKSNLFKIITGTIKDQLGNPLPGASIRIKGTQRGTSSKSDGTFTIDAEVGKILEFTMVGYLNKDITVGQDNNLNIILEISASLDQEIIVIGYGTQKKVNLTGSVSTLNVDQIKDRAQPNVLSSIQGTIPGITVISRPGQTPSINFRGRGNLGTSAPLFVIDGVISDADFFANLDPNTIESVSFLKDAAAASIYGSRAAYGVVLVTTKQGRDGKFQISYNGLVGLKSPTYKTDLVNSFEYAELFNEAKYNSSPSGGRNQGFTDAEIELLKNGTEPDLYPNTDWIGLIYDNNVPTTQHSLNFTGGSEKLNYFASLGYFYDKEFIRGRNNKRYNLSINTSSNLNDWLTFRSGVKYIQRDRNVVGGTPSMNNILIVPVTFVARQSNGEWGSVNAGQEASGTFTGSNPLRAYSFNDWGKNKTDQTMFELGLDIKPIKGLVITGQGSYSKTSNKGKSFSATKPDVPSFLKEGTFITGTGNTINSMDVSRGENTFLTFTGTADYIWENVNHRFEALLGASQEHFLSETLGASRQGFPSDNLTDLSAGATSGPRYQNRSSSTENKMRSYFSRLQYSYLDRYLFEANFRADASSRFFKDNRWGYFPSFSAGWRISEEGFMKGMYDWVDNLKLRVSYGKLGNINNVGNYDYFQNYAAIANYTFEDRPVIGILESKPANKSLSWETVAMSNIGLDFDVFKHKLSGTIEYYIKNTSDILLAYNVPLETGITRPPSQNIAKVRNTGVELSLLYRNSIGDISYTIGGNLATNNNRIVNLAASNDIIQNMSGNGVGKFILREGDAIGSFYGFQTDGLYTQEEIDAGHYYTFGGTTPNAGDIKFVPQRDKIEYGTAITNDDRAIIGNDVPRLTYGVNFSVNYKRIEFSLFGQGVNGADVGFEVYQIHPFFHGQDNPRRFHMSRWTEDNPNPHAYYPRIYDASSPHTAYNRAFSDYQLFNASYFRIKTIALGYKFPNAFVTKLGLTDAKVYVTGENLFTIRGDKKMKDFDPETAGSVIQAFGVKSISAGVNVSF